VSRAAPNANSAPKNATFSSAAELACTGPGGASKKPACAGPGGAASVAVRSSSRSRRAFSARSRLSSAATATGNSRSMRSRISLTLTTVRACDSRERLPDSSGCACSTAIVTRAQTGPGCCSRPDHHRANEGHGTAERRAGPAVRVLERNRSANVARRSAAGRHASRTTAGCRLPMAAVSRAWPH
jgi:hypothetical protein